MTHRARELFGYLLVICLVLGGGVVMASPLVLMVTPDMSGRETAPFVEYLPDPDDAWRFDTVLESTGWRPLPRANLGYVVEPVWSRLVLESADGQAHRLVLFNTRPGVYQLDVRVLVDDVERHHLTLGVSQPPSTLTVPHRYPAFALEVPGDGRVTVLSRIFTLGPTEPGWMLAGERAFASDSVFEHALWGLFTGAVLTMVLYNFALWRSLRLPMLLAYVVFGSLLLLAAFTVQGGFRVASAGVPLVAFVHASWILATLMTASMVVFAMFFFETRRRMPHAHVVLLCLLGVLGVVAAASVVAVFDWSLYRYTSWMQVVFGVTYLVLVLLAMEALRRGYVGAGYYLIGQGSLFIVNALTIVSFSGGLFIPKVVAFLFPLGALLDVSFLSLAIGQRLGNFKREFERQRELGIAHSRLATLGKTLGMVVHQWRKPLARQGAALTELDLLLAGSLTANDMRRVREVLLPRLSDNLDLLSATMSDFRRCFEAGGEVREFDPAEVIQRTLDLQLGAESALADLRLEWQVPVRKFLVVNDPALLIHVLLILVDNAVEALSDRTVEAPRLIVRLFPQSYGVRIEVEDNAGGIRVEPVEQVFSMFVSEKGGAGMGMGLYIARMLIEERMGGMIGVENTDRGARFIVRLPNLQQPPTSAPSPRRVEAA